MLKEPIKYTSTVRAVCLPQGKNTYAGKKGTVVGWGLLREGGSRPSVLQELTMEIWDNARCSSTYGSTAPAGIKDTMLCAGQKGKDSCSVSYPHFFHYINYTKSEKDFRSTGCPPEIML